MLGVIIPVVAFIVKPAGVAVYTGVVEAHVPVPAPEITTAGE